MHGLRGSPGHAWMGGVSPGHAWIEGDSPGHAWMGGGTSQQQRFSHDPTLSPHIHYTHATGVFYNDAHRPGGLTTYPYPLVTRRCSTTMSTTPEGSPVPGPWGTWRQR